MSDPRATFAVQLEDETSGAAMNAANAVATLRDRMDAGQKSLSEMRRAMRRLKGGTNVSADAVKELQKRIDAQKASLSSAQASYIQLGGTFDDLGKKTKGAAQQGADMAQGLKGVPGAAKGAAGGAAKMGAAFGLAAAGAALVVVALKKLVTATINAAKALTRYAVATADARREEMLRLEGLTKIRRWHGIAGSSARVLRDRIDEVSSSVAIGRDKVSGYAQQLERMGLRGGEAKEALEVMSITASAAGEQMARRFAGMAAGANATGQSVKRLADDFRARFGPIAEKQMLSLSVQATKFRENLRMLFSGLRIEGFLRAVKSIADLFSQSTASGRALKQIIENLFEPIQDAIDVTGPVVKRFFQGMIIGAQEVIIAVKRVQLWFLKAFGQPKFFENINLAETALKMGKIAAYGMAAGVAVLGGALAIVVAEGVRFFKMIEGIYDGIVRIKDVITDVDWKRVAGSVIDGLVDGLGGGVGRILGATAKLGIAAARGIKGALDIRSPSKVFEGLGEQTAAGMARGVEGGAPRVGRATEGMADAAEEGVAGSAAGGRGASVSIGDIVIQAGDTSDPRELAMRVREEIADLFEGIGIHMGAPA